ncbi:MAG: carboxypeptidase regulatory-like domain-containing protein [Planctomycetaceae bacterium]|nr:carboxypeptidase regulatory-like domain-containing protein [Planctomycetaceae bacterium]
MQIYNPFPAMGNCVFLAAVLQLSVTFSGCSSGVQKYVPEKLVPVTGTISIDGTPVAGVTLSFIPQSGTSGKGGYAVSDESGHFIAKDYSHSDGLEPGSYYVTFSRLLMPDGKPIPEGANAADVGAVESLPEKLARVQEVHKYQLTVESTPIEVPYDIKSK